MQKLSSTSLLPVVTKLLILLLVAKFISLGIWWYLPSEGVELNAKKSYQAKYQRVDFKNMLVRAQVTEQTAQQVSSSTSSAAYSMNSLVLKGLYGSRFNGFAIVAQKSSPKKTTIVSVGEVYVGYKLKVIELTQVIFSKSGKEYVLALAKSSAPNYSKSVKKITKSSGEVEEARVSRADIKRYSSNPSKIWKDIAIAPVKKGGKIQGFKINRIKAGSKMAQLGLKKGDIIIRANNVKLSSFNDAIKLYKNIDKLDTIALVVLRNNQEKEIIYEIH